MDLIRSWSAKASPRGYWLTRFGVLISPPDHAAGGPSTFSVVRRMPSCVEVISKKMALLMLVSNAYTANFLDATQVAKEFELLSRLVSVVAIGRLDARRDVLNIDQR